MPSSRGSQRQDSARLSSLRQTASYFRESMTNMVIDPSFDPTYFPTKGTRFPLGTPLTSKRSRKYYSDLDDERQFLLNLKEQWEKKLENLQEDHKFLTRMENLSKEEVADVAPLFTRSVEEQEEPTELHESPIAMPAAPSFQLPESPLELGYPSSLPPRPTGHLLDVESMGTSYIANGQIEITDPETLTALEKLEELLKYNQANGDQDLEQNDNEEDEEDEEKARLALNLMLRQFGDSL